MLDLVLPSRRENIAGTRIFLLRGEGSNEEFKNWRKSRCPIMGG